MSLRTRAVERAGPLALIAVGGFVGAGLRYAVSLAAPTGFPWGTLLANASGSAALGVLLYGERFRGGLSRETRLVVGTGFLSSFTTYSAFAAETAALAPTLAAVNVAANYALGFLGVLFGRHVARWLS